ncbi:MAG: sugar transporter permease, partial [Paenibacillaceae bacterium]|nr:sugar transporter permease [Paenibacillaceae bacterium]
MKNRTAEAAPLSQIPTLQHKRRRNLLQLREDIAGYAFISPMLAGLLVFTLFPILASFFLSFTNWNFVSGFSKT